MTIANGTNLDATDILVEHNADGTLKSKDCRAYQNAAQSIPSGVWTSASMNSTRWDTDTMHNTSTNNSRLTCKTAGKYMIGGQITIVQNATGMRGVRIFFNGTTPLQTILVTQGAGAFGNELSISTLYSLAVNDYVELQYFQDSGVALNTVIAGNESPEFWAVRVGT